MEKNEQIWNFIHVGNGYYQIVSTGGKALSVQSGKENEGEKALIQETYNGNDRQKWEITKSSRSYYVFRPKSAGEYSTDWVMSCGDTLSTSPNGLNVEQRAYSNNDNLKDEWELLKIGDEVMLLSVNEADGRDRTSCYASAMHHFHDRYDYNLIITDYISPLTCLEQMEQSKIFICRTHGASYEVADGYFLNWFVVENTSGEAEAVYWNDIYFDGTALVDFSEVELMLYVACETAKGGATTNNLVTASVNAGADCAIGFKESIYTVGANSWTEKFCELYASGITADQAAFSACSYAASEHPIYSSRDDWGLDSIEVVTP